MNKNLLIGLFVLILLVIGGYYLSSQNGTNDVDQEVDITDNDSMGSESNMMMSVVLYEQNDSGESGTATLEEKDGRIVVTIKTEGYPEDFDQPAHIHSGSCPDVGSIIYPLSTVELGDSESYIEATFEDLRAQAPLAINVHRSAAEANVYTACGVLEF